MSLARQPSRRERGHLEAFDAYYTPLDAQTPTRSARDGDAHKVPVSVHAKMLRLLIVYCEHNDLSTAIAAAGIQRRQFNNWRHRYPAFDADVTQIHAEHQEHRWGPLIDAARAGHKPSLRKLYARRHPLTKPKTRQRKSDFVQSSKSGLMSRLPSTELQPLWPSTRRGSPRPHNRTPNRSVMTKLKMLQPDWNFAQSSNSPVKFTSTRVPPLPAVPTEWSPP